MPSGLLERDGGAAIGVKFDAAIDEGHVEKRVAAAFFPEALDVPTKMMATFVRHQEVTVCRVAGRFIGPDLDAGRAIGFD